VSGKKEALQLKHRLEADGFSVTLNGSGHWEVRANGRWVSTFPQTPNYQRWRRNALADVRRWQRANQEMPA
jgi:hypothetical protein